MALKSSREGLRKELVDYLGNIIIDDNLKNDIINSVDDIFINNEKFTASVNELNEKIFNETSSRKSADNTLQNNINAESTARQEAISTIENLINNGTLKVDLLWCNATPSSEFAPQTISLDLSKYKFAYILFYRKNDDSTKKGNILIKKGEGSVCVSLYGDTVIARHVTEVSDNGVVFGLGHTDNIFMIPYQIYGVV